MNIADFASSPAKVEETFGAVTEQVPTPQMKRTSSNTSKFDFSVRGWVMKDGIREEEEVRIFAKNEEEAFTKMSKILKLMSEGKGFADAFRRI